MNSKVLPVFYTCPSQKYGPAVIDHLVEGLLRDEKKPRWSASIVDEFEKVEMMLASVFTLGFMGVPVALIDTPCPVTHCALQTKGEHLSGPLWAAQALMSVRIGREGVATRERVESTVGMIMTLPFTQYLYSSVASETIRRRDRLPLAASPLRLS